MTDFAHDGAVATAREIAQQAEVWEKIPNLIQRDEALLPSLSALLQDASASIAFSGAGTSAYVGDIVAPVVAQFAAAQCRSVPSTDFVSQPRANLPSDAHGAFFAFARSGNSPESVDSIEKLTQLMPKMKAYAVTCNHQGKLALDTRTEALLMPPETHDESFVMTSSFSSMTLYTAELCRRACEQKATDFQALASESRRVQDFYHSATMNALLSASRLIFLGSNALIGAARESALKILEMTAGAIPTMAESALGFRHGPKSFVNTETAVMVFPSHDAYTQQFDADIIRELVADGRAKTVVVAADKRFWARFTDLADRAAAEDGRLHAIIYHAEALPDDALAVLGVQHAQLLGMAAAIQRGISPDNPCPSGEVNRVVQGVKLYPYPH